MSDTSSVNPTLCSGTRPTKVLASSKFIEYTVELKMFDRINERRYFQLKRLYESSSKENRLAASNIVIELYKRLLEDNA